MFICVLAGFSNGYLSAFVVLRKSALQVGSLSHSLLPGIGVGILLFGLSQASAFVGALVATLIVGLGSLLVARSSRLGQETALAILFTTAFAGGLLLMEFAPVDVDIDHYLFGNILFASDTDLMTGLLGFGAGTHNPHRSPAPNCSDAVRARCRPRSRSAVADAELLVVRSPHRGADLDAPGSRLLACARPSGHARGHCLSADGSRGSALLGGGLVGASGATAALLLSHHFNTSPGGTIILTLGGLFALAFLLGPRHGIAARLICRKSV